MFKQTHFSDASSKFDPTIMIEEHVKKVGLIDN